MPRYGRRGRDRTYNRRMYGVQHARAHPPNTRFRPRGFGTGSRATIVATRRTARGMASRRALMATRGLMRRGIPDAARARIRSFLPRHVGPRPRAWGQ